VGRRREPEQIKTIPLPCLAQLALMEMEVEVEQTGMGWRCWCSVLRSSTPLGGSTTLLALTALAAEVITRSLSRKPLLFLVEVEAKEKAHTERARREARQKEKKWHAGTVCEE
jgi:hypothetical protein